MPNRSRSVAAAINTTNQPLIGWQYVTNPYRIADLYIGVVKVALTDLVTLNVVTGGREQASGDGVPIAASVIWPDHYQWTDRVKFMDYITLDIIQGGVSANAIPYSVKLVPVAA